MSLKGRFVAPIPTVVKPSSWDDLLRPNMSNDAVSEVLSWAKLVPVSAGEFEAQLDELRQHPPLGGVLLRVIDAALCPTDQALFNIFAENLQFPDYFGHNWDAFNECLSDLVVLDTGGLGSAFGDLPGVDAQALVVVLLRADTLLAESGSTGLAKFIRSVQFAVDGEGVENSTLATLRVVFQVEENELDTLLERFKDIENF
jgi:RNAse (barnase) inhibitor barstar